MRWSFGIVATLVVFSTAMAVLEGHRLLELLPLSLVVSISTVPVALPVMFTVSMAVGSMETAHRGALITRLNAAEDAANMGVLCADKTGTLTLNRLSVAGVRAEPPFSEDDIPRVGALASNEADRDPIDLAFLRTARDRGLLDGTQQTLSFSPFTPHTRRTEAIAEVAGRRVRAMKARCVRWPRRPVLRPPASSTSKQVRTSRLRKACAAWQWRSPTARFVSSGPRCCTTRHVPTRAASSRSCARSAWRSRC